PLTSPTKQVRLLGGRKLRRCASKRRDLQDCGQATAWLFAVHGLFEECPISAGFLKYVGQQCLRRIGEWKHFKKLAYTLGDLADGLLRNDLKVVTANLFIREFLLNIEVQAQLVYNRTAFSCIAIDLRGDKNVCPPKLLVVLNEYFKVPVI